MRIKDYTIPADPSRDSFNRDPSLIGLPVLAAFDFTTLYGRPGGPSGAVTPVANTPTANYVEGGAAAKAISDLGYANKSLVLADDDTLSLGNDFLLPTDCTDFLFYWWMKATAVGADGFNNRIIAIRQSNTDVVAVGSTYSGASLTFVEVISANAASTVFTDEMRDAAIDGALHMFAIHFESNGANWRARHFLDGELNQEKPFYARAAIPAKAGGDYGFMGVGNNVHGITGSVQRAGLLNLTGYSARTADSIVARQYADHVARLAAAIA